jgi:formamidopyrimidine-DNA glycosylase
VPELPEVEYAARTLRRAALGRRIVAAAAPSAGRRLFRPGTPAAVVRALAGARLAAVERRGKHLLLTLEARRGPLGLLSHLGMTGRWLARDAAAPAAPHARLTLRLQGGRALDYDDPRLFGRLRLVPGARFDAVPELAALGPDPLHDGVEAAWLEAALGRTRRPVKVALLDQRLLAGLGNIHAAEACWRARLDPRRRADRLGPARARALAAAIRASLRHALAAMEGPELVYVEAGGPNPFRVYAREGERCPRCRAAIRRTVQAQRSTFWCPGCQR